MKSVVDGIPWCTVRYQISDIRYQCVVVSCNQHLAQFKHSGSQTTSVDNGHALKDFLPKNCSITMWQEGGIGGSAHVEVGLESHGSTRSTVRSCPSCRVRRPLNSFRQIGPQTVESMTIGPRTIGFRTIWPRTAGPQGPTVCGPTVWDPNVRAQFA